MCTRISVENKGFKQGKKIYVLVCEIRLYLIIIVNYFITRLFLLLKGILSSMWLFLNKTNFDKAEIIKKNKFDLMFIKIGWNSKNYLLFEKILRKQSSVALCYNI